MSKIKIVPFKKEHFDIYRERELERDMLGDLIELFQSRTPEHGPSYTALWTAPCSSGSVENI
mgnify:CR=1 FL=1